VADKPGLRISAISALLGARDSSERIIVVLPRADLPGQLDEATSLINAVDQVASAHPRAGRSNTDSADPG